MHGTDWAKRNEKNPEKTSKTGEKREKYDGAKGRAKKTSLCAQSIKFETIREMNRLKSPRKYRKH